MVPPPDDEEHDCGWKAYAKAQEEALEQLREQLASVRADLEQLRRGHRSEKRGRGQKLPPPVERKADPAATANTRRENARLKDLSCDTVVVDVPLPAGGCCCERCGSDKVRAIGSKSSVVYEHVREHLRKKVHNRQTAACLDCGHVVTAPAPQRFGEKSRYAPSFVAHLVYSKWTSSMPQYRLEKAYRNLGIPISRSTMCDLVHRAARELAPLYGRMEALVRAAGDVHADETSIRQQGLDQKAFIWVFATPLVTVYRYATTRSGRVPSEVLADSEGRLVVDQYTGYNHVTRVGNRVRAGCLAHARRKVYEQNAHPEMAEALDLIGEIYRVEHDAEKAGDSPEQLLARRQRDSKPAFIRLLCWARRQRHVHEPRSKPGQASRYLRKYHHALGQFLRHPGIPPDNNRAEAALRRVAVGRSNYLFVGNEETGQNHAILYSFMATCEQHGVNPLDYLSDVLLRVQTHPAGRIDELLPHRWRPPDTS